MHSPWIAPLALGITLASLAGAKGDPGAEQALVPAGENNARVDAFGDPLPPGAVARLGTGRWRTYENPLLFTADGRHAITVHGPWPLDATSGRMLRRLSAIVSDGALLMPDKKTLLVAGFKTPNFMVDSAYFLDIETGKELHRVPLQGREFSWSADGKRVASRNAGFNQPRHWEFAVWDLEGGKQLRQWKTPANQLALSPDGKALAVLNGHEINLFDVADGKELRRWRSPNSWGSGDTGANKRIVYSPDGKIIASTEGGRVTLWDPGTGKPSASKKLGSVLATDRDSPAALAFSGDGRYLAAGCDKGALYVWDLRADKLVHAIADAGHGSPIYVLSFTADGNILVSQAHGFPAARLWDLASGKELSPTGANSKKIDALTFSPDGKIIAAIGSRDPLSLWDACSGKLLRRWPAHAYRGPTYGGSFAFLPGGKHLALSALHCLSVWSVEDGNLRYQTKGNGPYDNDTPGVDRQQRVMARCGVDEHTVVTIIPDSAMVGLFDIRSGKVLRSFRTGADSSLALVFLSPDRRTLVGITNAATFAWDVAKGIELFRLPTLTRPPSEASFSADGRMLFLTCWHPADNDTKYSVHLYEVASAKKRATIEYKVKRLPAQCAVASERLIAITEQDRIQLFDLLSGNELRRFQTDRSWVYCLAFSPDHKLLATGFEDTTVLVWDVAHLVAPLDPIKLTQEELAKGWANLLDDDAEKAFRAIRRLSRAPEQTIAFFGRRLQTAPVVPAEKIRQLVEALDSPGFAHRNQATTELLKLGEPAEASLAEALKKKPSLETTRRVEMILGKLQDKRAHGPWTVTGESLRSWRAVEILERIGTARAAALLTRLAKGAPYAVLTREAQTALQRLKGEARPAP
jgi:WD40 repeat protein